jgi:6-phosphofructokinase 1
VLQAAQRRGVGRVYGMVNGIAGFLEGKTVDLGERLPGSLEIELLKRTPSSYLGSCRFKLPDPSQDEGLYRRLVKQLSDLEIGLILLHPAATTAWIPSQALDYARAIGSPIRFGACQDHRQRLWDRPHARYGSAAKYSRRDEE